MEPGVEITLSVELLVGILIGVGGPLLIWGYHLLSVVRETLKMHKEPEKFGFGTIKTNVLLQQSLQASTEFRRDYVSALKRLDFTIAELSHYTQWQIKRDTGEEAPPFVRAKG